MFFFKLVNISFLDLQSEAVLFFTTSLFYSEEGPELLSSLVSFHKSFESQIPLVFLEYISDSGQGSPGSRQLSRDLKKKEMKRNHIRNPKKNLNGIFESLLWINSCNAPKSGAVSLTNVAETSERAANKDSNSELLEIKEEIQFSVQQSWKIHWSVCLPHIILFPWATQLWDCLFLLLLLHFGIFFSDFAEHLKFWSQARKLCCFDWDGCQRRNKYLTD